MFYLLVTLQDTFRNTTKVFITYSYLAALLLILISCHISITSPVL